MKKFFILFFIIICLFFIIAIISVKIFERNPRSKIAYEDSNARYFAKYRIPKFIGSYTQLFDECSFEDAIKNEKYVKAWFNENDKVIRIEFKGNEELMKIDTIKIDAVEYGYNRRGKGRIIIYLDKDDNIVKLYPVNNIIFSAIYEIIKGM